MTFRPNVTEFYLLDGLEMFHDLKGSSTDLMRHFRIKFALGYPSIFPELRGELGESFAVELETMPRKQFLIEGTKLVATLRRQQGSA